MTNRFGPRKSVMAQLIQLGFRPVVLNTLCAIAAILAIYTPVASAVTVTAVLAYIIYAARRPIIESFRPRSSRFGGGAAMHQTSRLSALAIVGILVATSAASRHDLVAVGLVLCAIILETTVRRMTRHVIPTAVNLPGYALRDHSIFPIAWSVLLTLIGTIMLAWVPVLYLNPTFALVIGGVALGISVICVIDAATLVIQRRGVADRLYESLSQYAPRFVLHWKAPAGTAYQVQMWTEALESVGEPFFYLVRTVDNFYELTEITDRPIVLRQHLEQLDETVVPSLRAALYVNTATVNNHYVRYLNLTHIQLNHGDSDKAPSFNPAFRAFDRNFVAGQAAIDRFVNHDVETTSDFFEVVGRPQVHTVDVARHPGRSRVDSTHPTIIYAPTWHGFYEETNYSSLERGVQFVPILLKQGYRVIFRHHPYSLRSRKYTKLIRRIDRQLRLHRTRTGTRHITSREAVLQPIFDLFNESDALIGDISSVIGDYLYSLKPFAMISMKGRDVLLDEAPVSACAYVIDGAHAIDPSDFITMVETMLSTDPMWKQRLSSKNYYHGGFEPAELLPHFAGVLRGYLADPAPPEPEEATRQYVNGTSTELEAYPVSRR